MLHATARQAIARALQGEGFAVAAWMLAGAGALEGCHDLPDELRRGILARALMAVPDDASPYVGPLTQAPLPGTAAQLAIQLAPAIAALPAEPARAPALLWALCELWPHASSDERPLLRTRLLNTLAADRPDPASTVSVLDLRAWQKRVPTGYGTQAPSVSSLRGMLQAEDPLAAYLVLAEHLGLETRPETVCWVLGSLVVRLLRGLHDRDDLLIEALAGSVALERLCALVPPEIQLTLISQLGHRIWWLRNRAGLRPIRESLDQATRPLAAAILSGDITIAQRAVQVASGDPLRLWRDCWAVASERLIDHDRDLRGVLLVMDAVRFRTGDGVVASDDAAALGAVLAGIAWKQRPV
jgi:hypothetical protein